MAVSFTVIHFKNSTHSKYFLDLIISWKLLVDLTGHGDFWALCICIPNLLPKTWQDFIYYFLKIILLFSIFSLWDGHNISLSSFDRVLWPSRVFHYFLFSFLLDYIFKWFVFKCTNSFSCLIKSMIDIFYCILKIEWIVFMSSRISF